MKIAVRDFLVVVVLLLSGCFLYRASATPLSTAINYCVILDSGGKVSEKEITEGEVLKAHMGLLLPISHMAALAINSRQLVVASSTVVRNLFTVAGDLLAPERFAWWKKYAFASDDEVTNLKTVVERRPPLVVKNVEYVKTVVLPALVTDYTLYLAKTGDLVVLLPRGKSLKEAGFLSDAVMPIAYTDFEAALSTRETYPVSGEHVIKLFDKTNKAPKHFFLKGHGFFDKSLFGVPVKPGDEAVTAQLKPAEYRAFLKLLAQINTQSLFVFSCFAVGANLGLMHQKMLDAFGKVLFELRAIKFPIIMGATTDVPMASFAGFDPKEGKLVDFTTYFDSIDVYTRRGNQKDLKAAIGALQGQYLMSNTPSIRYPGYNTLFRALETDTSLVVLTVTKQKALLLENKNRPLVIPAVENGALLYYPALIRLPLVVPGFYKGAEKLYPFMVSMAQGTFLHTFDKIDASDLTLNEFLRSLIGYLSPLKRGFIIDELICKAEKGEKRVIRGLVVKLSGAVVKSPSGVDTQVVLLTVLGRENVSAYYFEAKAPAKFATIADGQWYFVAMDDFVGKPVALGRIDQTDWLQIDEKRYQEVADQVIETTLPEKEVLDQASGGQESVDVVSKAAKTIIKAVVAIPVPPVLPAPAEEKIPIA